MALLVITINLDTGSPPKVFGCPGSLEPHIGKTDLFPHFRVQNKGIKYEQPMYRHLAENDRLQ